MHPVCAHFGGGLVYIGLRRGNVAHAAGDFQPHGLFGLGDNVQHQRAGGKACALRDFAGGGFEKVCACEDGNLGSLNNLRVRQRAGFQNHFQAA